MVAMDKLLVSSAEEMDAGPTFREAWEAAKKSPNYGEVQVLFIIQE